MVRTQIRLSEKQVAALKKLAIQRKVSVAELIRQAVDERLRRAAGQVDRETRKGRAIAAAGRFNSGLTDLSTNHDEYLAQAVAASTLWSTPRR